MVRRNAGLANRRFPAMFPPPSPERVLRPEVRRSGCVEEFEQVSGFGVALVDAPSQPGRARRPGRCAAGRSPRTPRHGRCAVRSNTRSLRHSRSLALQSENGEFRTPDTRTRVVDGSEVSGTGREAFPGVWGTGRVCPVEEWECCV